MSTSSVVPPKTVRADDTFAPAPPAPPGRPASPAAPTATTLMLVTPDGTVKVSSPAAVYSVYLQVAVEPTAESTPLPQGARGLPDWAAAAIAPAPSLPATAKRTPMTPTEWRRSRTRLKLNLTAVVPSPRE